MEKSDKSKSSHESIDQRAMDIIYIKYQSIWNRLQVNNTRKWTSKTPQTLFPLQKRGLIPAVLATASDTSRMLEDGAAKLCVPQTRIPVQLNIVKLSGTTQKNCFICREEFRISDMRNHVGTHILKFWREVEDKTILNGVEVSIYAVFEYDDLQSVNWTSCMWMVWKRWVHNTSWKNPEDH